VVIFMLGEAELSKEDAAQLLHEEGVEIPNLNKVNSGKDIFDKILPKAISGAARGIPSKEGASKEVPFSSGTFDATNFKTGKGDVLRAADKVLGREEAVELLRLGFFSWYYFFVEDRVYAFF